jgi:hypothetical protein
MPNKQQCHLGDDPSFTQENIDQQLQQIHLLDPSSSSENLEQLGPIIKQIYSNRQQENYLRVVRSLIEAKDAEIEKICGDIMRTSLLLYPLSSL